MEYLAQSNETENNKEYFYFTKGTEPKRAKKTENAKIDLVAKYNKNGIELTWNIEKNMTYLLEKTCSDKIATKQITLSNGKFVDTNIEEGKRYCYVVKCYFGDRLVSTSNSVCVSIPTKHCSDTNTSENLTKFNLWDELKKLLIK